MKVFHKISFVLSAATVASLTAYLSVVGMPGWLAYGPLVPVFLFFWVAAIVSYEGWLIAAAIFLPAYFLIVTFLSLGLLFEFRYRWHASAALFTLLVVGNCAYFWLIWGDAISSQGAAYTAIVLLINIVVGSIAGTLLMRAKRDLSNTWYLFVAHAAILLWLSWASFPWLGEWL